MRTCETTPTGGSRADVRRCGERGGVLAEFAVGLPFLLTVMLGTVDFGRVGYTASAVAKAAHAGAQYGSSSSTAAGDETSIREIVMKNLGAIATADEGSGAEIDVAQRCTCPPQDSEIDCADFESPFACPAGKPPRMYVEVTVVTMFNTMFPYPGVPHELRVARTASMRAW